MTSIKGEIKKLLVAKETKKYNKLLESKKMDYDKWVRGVEDAMKLDMALYTIGERCLTIDDEKIPFGGAEQNNDGKLAKKDSLCKLISISGNDIDLNCKAQYVVCDPKSLHKALEDAKDPKNKINGVILKLNDGNFAKEAFIRIHKTFSENKSLILIYSDEDTVDKSGNRCNPYFKPDWSPDTFLSWFYFGSFIAIKTQAFANLEPEEDVYHFVYKMLLFNRAFDMHGTNHEVVGHIPMVLFHCEGDSHEGAYAGTDDCENASFYNKYKNMKLENQIIERLEDMVISIIIPSKDHPDILFRCIDTLLEQTKLQDNIKIQIIVVDNGSSVENKTFIENIISDYNQRATRSKEGILAGCKYIYEELPFNFSHMCNTGRKEAMGSYLLFLNDDMEIIESDWLIKMLRKAHLPYAGAVGAKLLYPPTNEKKNIIQHAGITNLRIGPAHKLQFLSDEEDHYFGANRYVHDMMGVTGACLLVKASVFDRVNGFDEELAVAFNDVDLCYKIYEAGYYNIQCNDVILYHHESLSRGNDAVSLEKLLRLNKEKDYLYEKHIDLYGKDPFYNINLTTDMWESEYAPKYHYEVNLDREWSKTEEITDVINSARQDECVRVGMESAMDIYKWKYGVDVSKGKIAPSDKDMGFYFQGYTFVIGSNNACYERTLLLKNVETGTVYGVDVNIEYRPDIEANLPDQESVALTGYTAILKAGELPAGTYRFGMYMKDRTSSQRLCNYSNWTLDVK